MENTLIDHLHNLIEGSIFEDIVVLVVKSDVLQDNIDHVYILRVVNDAIY